MKRSILFWIVLLVMLAVDQAVKIWVRGAIPPHGSLHGLPFPGIFEITLQYNEGVAFGLLQGMGRFLAPIAIAIACGSAWYSIRHPKDPLVTHFAMGLLASGALGNLYDRLFNGRVTDMFWFKAIQFPVFNVADSCITVATIMLVLIWFTEAAKKETPAPAASSETSVSGTE